jgi:hypothetical protein
MKKKTIKKNRPNRNNKSKKKRKVLGLLYKNNPLMIL